MRLIDAEELLSELKKEVVENNKIHRAVIADDLETLIRDAPTIDPIIRCKDCKHLYKDGECPLRTWFTHTEDDFCSYGCREDGEE